MNQRIKKAIAINVIPSQLWASLTSPQLMQKWMDEHKIEVITDWKIGAPIVIRSPAHWFPFENKGTILAFEINRLLSYSHLSSLSHLPDVPSSYTGISFTLEPFGSQTILTLEINNFPTESIYKHFEFYWSVTLGILKQTAENMS